MIELIVDSFAGGGGASHGIFTATGRHPDIAINHDAEAIALHAANHPTSRHYQEDVWRVDPRKATNGQPVGLMWLSPDCKHFSKAKGGQPVSKRVRGLAWIAVRWMDAARPRVVTLENVEEFQTWGRVGSDGRPVRNEAGATFDVFVAVMSTGVALVKAAIISKYGLRAFWHAVLEARECIPEVSGHRLWRGLGYDVQWRELRACDYGTPTSRKRLFLVARCDGQSIVWPTPTHGKHTPRPWRTAAECIDWSLVCPSIFERQKPLVENTLKRIAAGLRRYVIESASPFIVSLTHHGSDRVESLHEPMMTITGAHRGEKAIIAPTLVHTAHGEVDRNGKKRGRGERDIVEPLPTTLATGNLALVAGFLAKHYSERKSSDVNAATLGGPVPTVTSVDHTALVTAHISTYYGAKRKGDARGAQMEMPLATQPTENRHAVVASTLIKMRGTSPRHLDNSGGSVEEPLPTISGGGIHSAEVRAFLIKYYGTDQDPRLDQPLHTLTTKERFGLVTVDGQDYEIADIGMRMLAPRELYRAQGFPDSYKIDIEFNGKPLTKTAQVKMVGNSVCPPLAAAIVAANYATRPQSQQVAA